MEADFLVFDVVSTNPTSGAVDGFVGPQQTINKIDIKFNKSVDLPSLTGALAVDNGVSVASTPSWNANTRTASYSVTSAPALTSSACIAFSASLSTNIRDKKGASLPKGSTSWQFIPGPCILSASPANFSTNLSSISGNVITINFNEELTATDLNAQVTLTQNPANNSVAITGRSLSGTILTINLSGSPSLTYSYQIFIDKNFKNTNGKSLPFSYLYRFSAGKYFDNLNGTVYDPLNKLTWMKCSQGSTGSDSLVHNSTSNTCDIGTFPLGTFQFCSNTNNNCNAGANTALLQGPPWIGGSDSSSLYSTCQTLNTQSFGGRTNWRVPTKSELSLMVKEDGTFPAIDANMFPNTFGGNYWSASPYAAAATHAWFVSFNDAVVTVQNKTGFFNVRCVATGS